MDAEQVATPLVRPIGDAASVPVVPEGGCEDLMWQSSGTEGALPCPRPPRPFYHHIKQRHARRARCPYAQRLHSRSLLVSCTRRLWRVRVKAVGQPRPTEDVFNGAEARQQSVGRVCGATAATFNHVRAL